MIFHALFPLSFILALIWYLVLPLFISSPNLGEAQSHFLEYVHPLIQPEPLEQARYLATVVVFWSGLYYFWKYRKASHSGLLRFFTTIYVSIFVLAHGFVQHFNHPYFSVIRYLRWFLIILVLSIAKLFILPFVSNTRWFHALARARTAWIVAIGLAMLNLLPSLYNEHSIDLAHPTMAWHLTTPLNDFAAIVNGRTHQVNYFSTYQNFLPHLLKPVFWLTGVSIGSFTTFFYLWMLMGLLLIFKVMRLIARTPIRSLALFIPWISMSFYPIIRSDSVRINTFNYFQMGALRLVPVWLSFFCLILFIRQNKPSKSAYGLGALGFLIFVNSIDFGLSAIFAATATLILLNQFRKNSIRFLKGFASALAFYLLIIFFDSGSLPKLSAFTFFQNYFAHYGYGMLPMPRMGLHWIMLATYLWAFGTGLRLAYRNRTLSAALIWSSIFGALSLTYFVGRSHAEVLPTLFSTWSLALTFLFAAIGWEEPSAQGRMAKIAIGAAWLLMLSGLSDLPKFSEEKNRIFSTSDKWIQKHSELKNIIQQYSKPQEHLMIAYAYQHPLAHELNVVNVYPYPDPYCFITPAQIEITQSIIRSENVRTVMGSYPSEFKAELIKMNFELKFQLEDFEVWKLAYFDVKGKAK